VSVHREGADGGNIRIAVEGGAQGSEPDAHAHGRRPRDGASCMRAFAIDRHTGRPSCTTEASDTGEQTPDPEEPQPPWRLVTRTGSHDP